MQSGVGVCRVEVSVCRVEWVCRVEVSMCEWSGCV